MMRIRVGLALTMLISIMFAAVSMLTSLHDFGIGAAVAAVAGVAYGLLDWIETR